MNEAFSLSSVSALSTVPGSSAAERISESLNKTTESKSLGQPSFSQVLAENSAEFVQTLSSAEKASIAGIKGEVGVYEVASVVMEAEQQLRMVTAVRDKVVQAYLEISRMQI